MPTIPPSSVAATRKAIAPRWRLRAGEAPTIHAPDSGPNLPASSRVTFIMKDGETVLARYRRAGSVYVVARDVTVLQDVVMRLNASGETSAALNLMPHLSMMPNDRPLVVQLGTWDFGDGGEQIVVDAWWAVSRWGVWLRRLQDARAAQAAAPTKLLTGAECWELGPGWLSHITPLHTDLYYRSRRSVSDSRGLSVGLEFRCEERVWKQIADEIVPTIQHDRPFMVRIRRPSGELAAGPMDLSVAQYRKLRAYGRGGAR